MPRQAGTGPASAGRSPGTPAHRILQARTGDQDYAEPLRIEDGRLTLTLGEGLELDGTGRLSVDLAPLLGSTLELVGGRLQLVKAQAVSTTVQDGGAASPAYQQAELQAVMDKLDAVIQSLSAAEHLKLA